MTKYGIALLTVFCAACGNIKKVDTTAMKEQMNNHKIIKVSNEDIVTQTDVLGKKVSTEVNTAIYKNCVVPLDSNLGQIKTFSLSELKSYKFKEAKEQEMADAFSYGLEHKESLSGNVQKLSDSEYLYVFPITENASINQECSKVVGFVYLSKQAVIKSMTKK